MRFLHATGLLLLVASPILTASCDDAPFGHLPDDAVIRWGTSFGECIGYCTQEVEVTPTLARLTRTSSDPSHYPARVEERDVSGATWSDLRAAVEASDITSLDDIYGCPDCADGGAEWVEVETQGSKKKVVFEAGDPPRGVASLVDALRSVRSAFPD